MKTRSHAAIEALAKAEETFLKAHGWTKIGLVHWTPKKRIGHVFKGDRVFRSTALQVQKEDLGIT